MVTLYMIVDTATLLAEKAANKLANKTEYDVLTEFVAKGTGSAVISETIVGWWQLAETSLR